uniref:AP complex subunit sigma n=1 Tax=Lygus hesperus TaxID=30085 RepID=A0A0A9XA94_LYGHE
MIHFLFIINKHGKIRFTKYYRHKSLTQRRVIEHDVFRNCLAKQHLCMYYDEQLQYRVVYQKFASLFLVIGGDHTIDTFATIGFLHLFVRILSAYFSSVCELDLIYNIHIVHIILDEMLVNG